MWERGETCTEFWWERQKKNSLERQRRRWRMKSKWTLGRFVGGCARTGFTCFRIGTVGELL
jgi:hypothetical protein